MLTWKVQRGLSRGWSRRKSSPLFHGVKTRKLLRVRGLPLGAYLEARMLPGPVSCGCQAGPGIFSTMSVKSLELGRLVSAHLGLLSATSNPTKKTRQQQINQNNWFISFLLLSQFCFFRKRFFNVTPKKLLQGEEDWNRSYKQVKGMHKVLIWKSTTWRLGYFFIKIPIS